MGHVHASSTAATFQIEAVRRTSFAQGIRLQTDISPCSERKDSFVCLNCNFRQPVVGDHSRGNQVSQYYNKVYAKKTVPSFVRFWTNSSASAWREDGAALKDGLIPCSPTRKAQYAVYNDVETYGFSFGIDSEGGPEVDSGYDPNKDPVIKLERPKLRYLYPTQT